MPTARPTVELLYADDCPHVAAARGVLLRAFSLAGLDPHWREWRTGDPRLPRRLGGLGSPTILVGGYDVAGDMKPAAADCCRVYQQAGRLTGVPAAEQIAAALRAQVEQRSGTNGDLKTAQLNIAGMHCGGCADAIQALLAQQPGVTSARVSHGSGEGHVVYDPSATDVRRLIQALEQAGYRASLC